VSAIDPTDVARRLEVVRSRVAGAASGRDVAIVAVTKGFGADAVRAALGLGLDVVGENYAQELLAKAAELAADPVPAVVVSDSVLYPLIGRRPVPPALFWHRGLSFPADGPGRAAFDARFRRDILAAGSDLVVMDGPRTWMSVRLDEFPWLVRCLREDGRREIGRFALVPLDRACLARQASDGG